ncbi:hypothetical protein [Flavobacterium sp.]|uniref:hypothetical protein n=1 Tax=Flavobacterium sp. TaxID=239 RepID=UPI001B49B231|nr:hypothetical protein [Flavobacterium sp.]MBP6126626.1 hypothetical protein [Flavobacterium sp.]
MPPLYPIQSYNYVLSISLEINLENLIMFHKYQLLKAYVFISPLTIYEHNKLIDATNEIVDNFKDTINDLKELNDINIKWQYIDKIKNEQNSVLEKSISILDKLNS